MKLSIRFYIDNSKINKQGKSTLKSRLTFRKQRKEFSTGQFINPNNWQSKQQLVKPPEPDAEIINSQLSLIRTKLNQAFLFLQVRDIDFTVNNISKQYKGETNKKDFCVMEVYNIHSARVKKLIGIDIKQVTYQKYLESEVHLKGFIKHKFKQKDIQFKVLRSSFLTHYELSQNREEASAKHLK